MFITGTSSPSSPQGHPTSAEHESSNVKNELREMQSKQGSKKKQATVSFYFSQLEC